MASIQGLNHITLAVGDLARSFDFYVGVLGCTPVARWSRGVYLTAGDLWLALLTSEKPIAARSDYSHIAFTVAPSDFDPLRVRLETAGVSAWSENRSEGESFYFRDPDGHQLEIHVGDLQSRLAAMKADPWDEIEFF